MPAGKAVSRLRTQLEKRLPQFLLDLETLVGMDSFSHDREDVNHVVDWLDGRLRAAGFEIHRYPQRGAGDDLLASRGQGPRRIVLLGHSDTVFPRGTAAARPMATEGDHVRGPGVCDMKGGLLTGIYAIEALDALGLLPDCRIDYLVVSDEEVDKRHSIDRIRRVSRGADAVLTLESARANGDIVVARKGVYWISITARGRAAHAGVEPEQGRSAVLALAHLIVALDGLNDPARGVTVNTGLIDGGRLPSIVADIAHAKVDLRAFERAALEAALEKITVICDEPAVPDVRFTLVSEEVSPPMPRTEGVARLEALALRAASELDLKVGTAHTGGAADAAFAADEGVPALDGLGPVGGLDHGPDEYIELSSIVPRAALLARLILTIAEEGV